VASRELCGDSVSGSMAGATDEPGDGDKDMGGKETLGCRVQDLSFRI